MKILVTGATGFLGSRLCRHLADHGHHVIATGRDERKAALLLPRSIPFSPCDLMRPGSLSVKGMDAVIHCAARSSVWGRAQDFYRDNVSATERLALRCRSNSVPLFIQLSTPSIYAALEDRFDLDETALPTPRPLNHYAETKLEAERRLQQLARDDFRVRLLRPQAIVGPGETSILPRFLRVNETSGIPVLRGGRATTDLIPVENVNDFISLLLRHPQDSVCRSYNLSNGQPQQLLG